MERSNEVVLLKEKVTAQRNEIADLRDELARVNADDAELGRKLRELVGGGKFDVTDSPTSFMNTCRQMVADMAAKYDPI
jgi:hypothetical protein